MATTIGVRIATAAVAAAVAVTGFAPPTASAGIVDLIHTGLSFSTGEDTDYSPTPARTAEPSGGREVTATPMASSPPADNSTDIERILTTSPAAKGAHTGVVDPAAVWPDTRTRNTAQDILARINAHRRAHGEQPLANNDSMSAGAQQFAEKLARTKVLTHDSGMYKYAEILAMRTATSSDGLAEDFARQWENSPSHRALMHRDSFTVAGIGVAFDDQSGQVFAVVRLYYS
ncbi:CAP domain-containing protein [Corynebacterium mendelii]|uniref:SCP domain-containing protein n=1 Tax=Corynebacterium mendelii TaxID=2765362 RepID=A0A939DZE2_9CORY|nr:CAP domain-containing protein [Corynebacterium mendelii]MBN9643023.1 hypothetical protein [Corynebacterium mendelii]